MGTTPIRCGLRLAAVFFSAAAVLVLSGCGGGSSSDTTTSGGAPAGASSPGSGGNTYTLSVSASGGVITSTPAGIQCPGICSTSFSSGVSVTLNATPNTGYTFSGWSGACTGSTCAVSMNQAQNVGASFTINRYALNASVSAGSGTVSSTPSGLSCSASCSANFDYNTQVTLTATPASGYTFAGWSGACSGSGTCSVTMSQAQTVAASFTPASATATPLVLYTDALSGPTSGGENNAGAYLSVFGKNFGASSGMGTITKVYIGTSEVANYRYLGASKVYNKLGIQQITVQVGSLGGAAQGVALPVRVVVSGVSSNANDVLGHALTFTPNPGRILFVSLTGNDSTAVAGDITKPWRHLQLTEPGDTPSGPGRLTGGIYATFRAGDHVVIRGGNWSDTGFDSAWIRFCDSFAQGSAPTGASGTGWIHFTAYPGPINGNAIEDVHYSTPDCSLAGNCAAIKVEGGYTTTGYGYRGGFQGPWNALVNDGGFPKQTYNATIGQYISISDLHMDLPGNAARDAAPLNMQNASSGHWRVVNNELGPWVKAASPTLNAAAVSGHGDQIMVLGNYIHDIDGTSALQNHGIYADDTAQNWEIAYNWILNATGGSLIQLNDSGQASDIVLVDGSHWQGFVGFRVHHNWLENAAKYGLNIASSAGNARNRLDYQAWNNVVVHTGSNPIRVQSPTTVSRDATFAYNTLYDFVPGAAFEDEGSAPAPFPAGSIRIYNNIVALGPDSSVSCSGDNYWFSPYDGIAAAAGWDFENNLYFDNHVACGMILPGSGTAAGVDPTAIQADPQFVAPSGGNFSLQASSPAVDTALKATPMTVTNDFTSTTPRPTGAHNDIGAYER